MTWTALKRPKRCESEGYQSRTHDRSVNVSAITLLVSGVECLQGAPDKYKEDLNTAVAARADCCGLSVRRGTSLRQTVQL